MDLEAVRAALRAQKPDLLLEQPEGQWLDAKKKPYELREPRAVEELAKDVCAFANGGGGVIVLGIGTRVVDDVEILDRIIPVDRASVDRDQIRKLIRAHITPAPRGISVEWSGDQQGCRVLYIDIPVQQAGILFVVAAPVGKPGAPRTDTVAVPVREADGTHWLARTEIQRLLSAGVAASGMPIAEALADGLREALAPAAPRVGQGLPPSRQQEMRDAYEQLRFVGVARPSGEAYLHGLAAVQEFEAAQEGQPGWMLCVVAGRAPVAIAAPVWWAITAEAAAKGDDALTAIGWPIPGADRADPGHPWAVPPDAECIHLNGGSWGAGRFQRSVRGEWMWEPTERFSFDVSRHAREWTDQQPAPQLRLRALVTWPWDRHGRTINRHQDLEDSLPRSTLSASTTWLSRHRGGDLPDARWDAGPRRNTPLVASYTSTRTAPDGRPAISGSVMISVEDTMVTCADFLLEETTAWAAALPRTASTRLSLDDVTTLLTAAWATAVRLLRYATVDPAEERWGPPAITELRIVAEGPHDQPSPDLGTLIDLTPLGLGDSGSRSEMSITITRSPHMTNVKRRALTHQALMHLAPHFEWAWTTECLARGTTVGRSPASSR
ncbi:helix-turn-helix domain-containing protein [Streptomyces sp. Sce081]|uniref:AlbA family DNA-binding domain-containing protein n=1 Tax=Streptomyces sp. Sce081 TaxID=3349853 RepID=UPI0035F27E42